MRIASFISKPFVKMQARFQIQNINCGLLKSFWVLPKNAEICMSVTRPYELIINQGFFTVPKQLADLFE